MQPGLHRRSLKFSIGAGSHMAVGISGHRPVAVEKPGGTFPVRKNLRRRERINHLVRSHHPAGGVDHDLRPGRQFHSVQAHHPDLRRDAGMGESRNLEIKISQHGFLGRVIRIIPAILYPVHTVRHSRPSPVRRGREGSRAGEYIFSDIPLVDKHFPPELHTLAHNEVVVVVRIQQLSSHALFLIIDALGGFCLRTRHIQRRQQHRGENRDDRNNNQQLDQSELFSPHNCTPSYNS